MTTPRDSAELKANSQRAWASQRPTGLESPTGVEATTGHSESRSQAESSGPHTEPVRVLMVCTGNICRSIMAHQVLFEAVESAGLSGHVLVDSAGVSNEEEGNPIDSRAARVLREAGYAVPTHRARQVRASELADWDLVLAMTSRHYATLQRLLARSDWKASKLPRIEMFRDYDPEAHPRDLDLPDPWYGGHQDFLDTLEVIERTTPSLLGHLRRMRAGQPRH